MQAQNRQCFAHFGHGGNPPGQTFLYRCGRTNGKDCRRPVETTENAIHPEHLHDRPPWNKHDRLQPQHNGQNDRYCFRTCKQGSILQRIAGRLQTAGYHRIPSHVADSHTLIQAETFSHKNKVYFSTIGRSIALFNRLLKKSKNDKCSHETALSQKNCIIANLIFAFQKAIDLLDAVCRKALKTVIDFAKEPLTRQFTFEQACAVNDFFIQTPTDNMLPIHCLYCPIPSSRKTTILKGD